MIDNIILATDSYKLTHAAMYPEGTKGVYSYLEARKGARDPYTVFFGLQAILEDLEGVVVTAEKIAEAKAIADVHLGPGLFNEAGWTRVLEVHGGRLPLRIRAVLEGTVVPVGNVLMTVENTDPELPWLTNALESLLLHVWYPTTVATSSRIVKEMLAAKLKQAGEPLDGLGFMLHDFGYRGVSSHESAAIGGAAHLVSFNGTDTLAALQFAQKVYHAELSTLGFSVPATEHSIMTSLGQIGERPLVRDLLKKYPTGILSLVGDSYDIHRFTSMLGVDFKDEIMARDGKVVVRPDSGDPVLQVPVILEQLWDAFGGEHTDRSYRRLDPHVGVLWGDGLDGPEEIERIVDAVMEANFSPANLVFGMGGGLLQKINRDTERFAFKCSAQKRSGVWIPIQKDPLDKSKASKPGRLALVKSPVHGELGTIPEGTERADTPDLLETVFENGRPFRRQSFDDVRERAAI
jgi:nicotinamide phosphoribosyltransferase